MIDVLNSLHISTPLGNIGVPHIGHVNFGLSTGSGQGASAKPKSQLAGRMPGATPRGVATTAAFTKPAASTAGGHQGPLVVHGDIVVRARENELGRVTRRQVQKAMAG